MSDQCRTGSPVIPMRINSQSCPPAFNTSQQFGTNVVAITESNDLHKTDFQIQRTSSHYLTVNSGWINPESTQKPGGHGSGLNVGQPVIGTNGQIIGVNTSSAKGIKNIHPNDQEHKEEKKVVIELSNQPMHPNLKQNHKEEESHIFSGLNQPLTPEVMQKINEQQQIFIQQNQKQIEMAMKGFRTQVADNGNTSHVKSQCQNNYMPHGQLVIQNGTVMKSNPGKMPPWQVKRNDIGLTHLPGNKLHKIDDIDYEDGIMHINDDARSGNNNFSASPLNEHNQSMCSRVPPLPQHYSTMTIHQQWPTENIKRKAKNKSKKKANSDVKNIGIGNNGMRILEENKLKMSNEQTNNNPIPSFMDDPNGYLAQQTVLLNNTISRQVGIHNSYEHAQFDNSNTNYATNHIEFDKNSKLPQNANKIGDLQPYRSNLVPNPSPSPNSTPDSSVLPDKTADNAAQCCKGCIPQHPLRRHFGRHQIFNKTDTDGTFVKNYDDSPVTSSMFTDRSQYINDGPIQAGTVSTSNVSPLPECSPTPSNSSRSTGPPTPVAGHSPGPTAPTAPLTGTQMMHFISNHNVNKNLMEVDNISLVGVKPGGKRSSEDMLADRKRVYNTMPGYCPPPHLGGGPAPTLVQASFVQSFITTMAGGFSVTRDTVTSVLAGKAQTATTSINASTDNFIRPPPPPSVNLATSYAIPNNQPDPFLNSVNLPTSYPLHIAGTTAQNMIMKSPLEMVQNVIGSISTSKNDAAPHLGQLQQSGRKTSPNQILISSTKQIVISSGPPMPPPPPKTTSTTSPIQVSSAVTSSASVTRVVPNVVAPPTVVVNTLPAPFVLQPSMMAVDNQVVQQNTVIPQIVTGGLVTSGPSPDASPRQIDIKTGQAFVQGVAMLSPEGLNKKSKKKKGHAANATSVLQIAAPQQNNIMVHHTSPQHNTSPQFSPRGFQLSPNNNMNSTPVLQALTIVPGKSGAPHIVMSGQGASNNFGSQQIISNTSPSQQINLLQPVNLLNNATGVMSNFPAFQQFIVPNIGGMMMTTDGTIIQDNSTGVQLQLQTVNGQNVLTPVQNSGVFAAGTNAGVVIRAQNQQGKIIQSQHSPGAQFLSPNSQVMMSSPNFNSQLSPLLANLSPTNVTYQNAPQIRSNVQQDFIQTNQMGQAVVVPLSPKSASNHGNNSTFVQQNTTIVQQQTTLVSNPRADHALPPAQNLSNNSNPRLLANKRPTDQIKNRNFVDAFPPERRHHSGTERRNEEFAESRSENNRDQEDEIEAHARHSVSTQTLVNQRGGKSPNGGKSPCGGQTAGCSPPDTTTHSPLGPLERAAASPRLYAGGPVCAHAHYADTTTESPEPHDNNSLVRTILCLENN